MSEYLDEVTVESKTMISSDEFGMDEALIETKTTVFSAQEWTIHLASTDYFGNPLTTDITYIFDSSAVAGSVGPNDTDSGILT